MEFILLLIIFLLSIPIGEYFGRSKHIGKWWTVTLMTCGIIPGLIALITSPKATKVPSQGKSYRIFGWILLVVFGIGGLVLNFIDHSAYQNYSGFNSDYITQQLGLRLIIATWIVIIGFYLIELSKGHIVNNNPKYYFQNFKSGSSNSNSYYSSKDFTIRSTTNIKHHLYFIEENNEKAGPFSFDELAQKRIPESTLIWRNGLDNWIPAKQLQEISEFVIYNPPPFPKETGDKNNKNNEIFTEGSFWVTTMLELYGTHTIDVSFNKKEFIKKQLLYCIGATFLILIWDFFDPNKHILVCIPIFVFFRLVDIITTKKLRLVISKSYIQFWSNDEMKDEVLISDFMLTIKCKALSENKVVLKSNGTLLSHPEMAHMFIDKVIFVPRRYTFKINEDDYFKKEFSRDFYQKMCEAIAVVYYKNKV